MRHASAGYTDQVVEALRLAAEADGFTEVEIVRSVGRYEAWGYAPGVIQLMKVPHQSRPPQAIARYDSLISQVGQMFRRAIAALSWVLTCPAGPAGPVGPLAIQGETGVDQGAPLEQIPATSALPLILPVVRGNGPLGHGSWYRRCSERVKRPGQPCPCGCHVGPSNPDPDLSSGPVRYVMAWDAYADLSVPELDRLQGEFEVWHARREAARRETEVFDLMADLEIQLADGRLEPWQYVAHREALADELRHLNTYSRASIAVAQNMVKGRSQARK